MFKLVLEKAEEPEIKLMPIYRAMLEASGLFNAAQARTSKAFYCVLAERAEDVKFDVENACGEGGQSESEDLIVGYLTSIAKGIFYPPKVTSGKAVWEQDYAQLIWRSLEEGIDCAWIEDQKSRMENAR